MMKLNCELVRYEEISGIFAVKSWQNKQRGVQKLPVLSMC